MKHFLSVTDLAVGELSRVLADTSRIKKNPRRYRKVLRNKHIALVFEKPSTRTRLSFEAGIRRMGGSVSVLQAQELQLARGESVADTARVISRYVDAVMIRTYSHDLLVQYASHSEIPVINGLSDLLHPCQVLSDVFTIGEYFGSWEGRKVAYLGDGGSNVAHSWILAADRLSLDLRIACPAGFAPAETVIAGVSRKPLVVRDPAEALRDADVVYTDVWVSMGTENTAEARKSSLVPYQVNNDTMNLAATRAIALHCLPAHKGEEISEEVFERFQKVIFDQAENRMHTQMALLKLLLGS